MSSFRFNGHRIAYREFLLAPERVRGLVADIAGFLDACWKPARRRHATAARASS